MKVILHIGQSKTGTSAIQNCLSQNRELLLKRGILYPDAMVAGMTIGLINHNGLADSLVHRKTYPFLSSIQYRQQIDWQIASEKSIHTIILSAEHFFGGEPRIWNISDKSKYLTIYKEKLTAIKKYLATEDVEVIVYLRNQVDWFRSSMAHLIRYQLVHDKNDIYLSDRQYFELVKPLLCYGQLLDCWADTFGRSSITAVPYNKDQLIGGDVILDFANRIGILPSDLKDDRAKEGANISLSAEYTELKKILNRKLKSKHQERAIITCLERLSAKRATALKYRLDPEVELDIRAIADKENSRINQYFVTSGLELLLPTSGTPYEAIPDIEVARAAEEFAVEFGRLEYKLLVLKLWTKYVLRNHFIYIHVFTRCLLRFCRVSRG